MMHSTAAVRDTYSLEFSESQQEEIISLGFEPFEPDPTQPMIRGQWMAIAEMALGKAVRIERGDYEAITEDGFDSDDREWAEELRDIAHIILGFFQPGDGKL